MGLTYVQTGKDLTQTQNLVVTGGSLIHTQQTSKIASYALYDPAQPHVPAAQEGPGAGGPAIYPFRHGAAGSKSSCLRFANHEKGDKGRWRSKIKRFPKANL